MRQFITASEFDKEGLLQIGGKDFRYFRNVLRLCPGDMVSVRVPSGDLVNATLAKIDERRHCAVLQICDTAKFPEEHQSEYNDDTEFYLFQFVAKSSKMDLIVRQSTECGVCKIIPVAGEYAQAGVTEKNFRNSRYERVIKEARQQSGSPVATEIYNTMTLNDALVFWRNEISGLEDQSIACVLYERTENTKNIFGVVDAVKVIKKCALFCGSEGGISPGEIQFLCGQGVIPIHFETNILRCETAALYGIACMQNLVTGKKNGR